MVYLCTCKECSHKTTFECLHIPPDNSECKCCTYEEDGMIYHKEELMEKK